MLWRSSRGQDRAAKTIWNDFSLLVERFGNFIDERRSDNLHSVLNHPAAQQTPNLRQLLRQCDFVPAPVFWGPWKQTQERLNETPNAANFLRLIESFNWLVSTYDNHVIRPFFRCALTQLQEPLPPALRQELGMSRDALTRFLDDYDEFQSRALSAIGTKSFFKMVFLRIPPL